MSIHPNQATGKRILAVMMQTTSPSSNVEIGMGENEMKSFTASCDIGLICLGHRVFRTLGSL